MNAISKKLSVVAGAMTYLIAAPVPAEIKMKYIAGLALGYAICQGAVDVVKAWKGRKAGTASNGSEA